MNEIERPTANSARIVRIYSTEPERLLTAFRRAVERLPRWSVESPGRDEVRAVRATRLLRFKDDVIVRVYPAADGARAVLTSVSRVGKGDLGQNPRNLGELLRALDTEMDDLGGHSRDQAGPSGGAP